MQAVQTSINNVNEFYKNQLQAGYKLKEVDDMTFSDLQHYSDIFKEPEMTIDKAFPWLF